MTDRHEEQEGLSPQGQARREAMLGHLVGEISLVRRRRRARRAVLSSTATILLCFGVFRYANMNPDPSALTPNQQVLRETPTAARDAITIEYVQTDPDVAERLRAAPESIVVQIDDSRLIEVLIEIGRPAGLIQFGQRLALSAPVTDEELTEIQNHN